VETRKEGVIRAVAIVATQSLTHGEELYVDYLNDQRVCPEQIDYQPEWLIEPPASSPYLQKKEFVA